MKKYTYTEKKDTRSGFGDGLTELGKTNPNVVALCADLTGSLKMNEFDLVHLFSSLQFNSLLSQLNSLLPSSQYMFLIRKHIPSNWIRTSHLLVMNPPWSH